MILQVIVGVHWIIGGVAWSVVHASTSFGFSNEEAARLDRFTKEEWWDVMHRARPDLSREDFDLAWEEFIELKRRRGLQ